MKSIVLLGAGNVSLHLCNAINKTIEFKVIQVYNRSIKALEDFPISLKKTTQLDNIKNADIYIITVPDDVISSFSEKLPFKNRLVVHISGSVPINAISKINRKGVFYPLQSFSKKSKINFSDIPICVEAEENEDLKLLNLLGNSISNNVQEITSKQREQIHLSAVIVNNFVNYLYQVGYDLMEENSLSFDLLKPLIFETANKINKLSPTEAQTGPAKRKDLKTIEKHLHLLKDSPYKILYQQVTESILNKYNNQ